MNARDASPHAVPHRSMRRNLRQLASDVVTLVELQAELLQVDLRDWFKGIVWCLVLAGAALVFGLAAIPVLLFSLAYLLVETTELSMAAALLISGGAGFAIAAVCVVTAVVLMKRDQRLLHRSASELRRNVRWLKEVLLTSAPTPAAD